MKQATNFLMCMFLIVAFYSGRANAGDIKSAGVKGTWNVGATWIGGVVPTASDNVTIANGDTVTLNGARDTCKCNNLTIGEGTATRLRFITTDTVNLVINGNLIVSANATLIMNSNTIPSSAGVAHTINLKGDLTNSGTLDFRTGTSGSTLSVCNLTLSGSTNSILNVPYVSSSSGEFNSITINKSSGAKVILASDIITAGGSTTGPTICNAGYNFISGLVETGNFKLVYQGSTSAQVKGYSELSYVVGNFARGLSSSAGGSKDFPVGDANGYRPLYVRSTTSGTATGHLVIVKCVPGNANTGSSVLSGGIDKVSAVRYHQVTYSNPFAGAATMSFDLFKPTYGADDGVAAGNTNLRVAISSDNRATWTGLNQSIPDTTVIPSQIAPDSLIPANVKTLASGSSLYIAIARVTGTTENSLVYTGTSVRLGNETPSTFLLSQNYPNPFNPTTAISYQLSAAGNVTLTVFDVLGKEVAILVNEKKEAGEHTIQFNASDLSSGMYFYTLHAGNVVETKKMILMK
jgi:hypothetical protein